VAEGEEGMSVAATATVAYLTEMQEKVLCPVCQRYVALRPNGKTARHGHRGRLSSGQMGCDGSNRSRATIWQDCLRKATLDLERAKRYAAEHPGANAKALRYYTDLVARLKKGPKTEAKKPPLFQDPFPRRNYPGWKPHPEDDPKPWKITAIPGGKGSVLHGGAASHRALVAELGRGAIIGRNGKDLLLKLSPREAEAALHKIGWNAKAEAAPKVHVMKGSEKSYELWKKAAAAEKELKKLKAKLARLKRKQRRQGKTEQGRSAAYYASSPGAYQRKLAYDKKFNAKPHRKAYRAEVGRERYRRGLDGKGGKDVSHGKRGFGLEDPSKNRARQGADGKSTKREGLVGSWELPSRQRAQRLAKTLKPPQGVAFNAQGKFLVAISSTRSHLSQDELDQIDNAIEPEYMGSVFRDLKKHPKRGTPQYRTMRRKQRAARKAQAGEGLTPKQLAYIEARTKAKRQ
jgi:hypothetical protein